MFNTSFMGQPQRQQTGFFNQQTQPQSMHYNAFPQYNQNVNTSDTELKAVIDTYRSLYNSLDWQCLFRLPVFNPIHANMPKIQFNGNTLNEHELQYLMVNAQQTLNPDPMNLTTCLLIGADNIQKRVQIDKETCDGIIKQLDEEIGSEIKKIDDNLEGKIKKDIMKIQENNAQILKRVIRFEKKLFCIAKKLKRADVNLESKMRIMNVLKELWKQMVLIDKNTSEIRLMIDGRPPILT